MENRRMSNRVAQDLDQWDAREKRMSKIFSLAISMNKALMSEKLMFYSIVASKYKGTDNPEERVALHILKQERRKLENLLYPNLFVRLFRRFVNLPFAAHHIAKENKMAIANQQELKELVFRAGFKGLENKLDQHLAQGRQEFSLPVSYYMNQKQRVNYELTFYKDQNNKYSFDSYSAVLLTANKQEATHRQVFRIESDNIISAEQACNLLSGRAIRKEFIS